MKKHAQRGITLVALVVTVVILLILVGISISALTNQGIFAQANRAIDEQTKASMKEQIAIYISEATYDYYLNNPEGKTYLEFIAEYLENKEDVLIDIVEQNEDEVILNYTQGKNIVQLLLSSDGTLEIIGSGTTTSGIEDIYAPKVKEKDKTKASITVTITDASGVLAYAYSLENVKPNADSSIWNEIESPAQTKQITITGLETEKTYYIFAKDTKGNISEGVACTTGEYAKITVVYKESSTATGTLEIVNTKENATITLISKPSNLNKEGYDFIGWSESEDAEEALDSQYVVPNYNVTLYPVWKILDGAVVTPINDVTTWLKTARISKQYSYTTIEQVIADSTCTESLMNNENAMKYLARSTEFADAICASETTMTSLGQSAYVDDTVLNSDSWVVAICDSTYFESVLNVKVPTMTSNTSPSGVASCPSAHNEQPYYVFDGNNNTEMQINSMSSGIIQYKFVNPVKVQKVYFLMNNEFAKDFAILGSNDGSSWNTIHSGVNEQVLESSVSFCNNNYYLYYRFNVNSTYRNKGYIRFNTFQFYGR